MNEKNIISNFKEGNKLNIERIIEEYSNYLFTVIKNICGDILTIEDIEEIIFDVFLALWKNKDKLDEEKNIKPYISSIAHNLTKKKLTEINPKFKIIELDDNLNINTDNWIDFIENKLKIEELNYILKDLSEEDYQIFTLFYYNSNKTKEIAKKLDISNMKVKTKLHRIRNLIKKKLKERGYSV